MTNTVKLIKYEPQTEPLNPIPWPSGQEPKSAGTALNSDGTLPKAGIVIMTFTTAEAKAAADVLTPGVHFADWTKYSHKFSEYEKDLTNRSPARGEKRLASFHLGQIGDSGPRYMMLKSELHPATDGKALPLARLVQQILSETGATIFLTTGTAGGAGEGTLLGDVNVAVKVHADFTTRLKDQPFSNGEWNTTQITPQQQEYLATATNLLTANSSRLPEAPRQPQLWYGSTVSTDFFAFDAENDGYHLRAYDPEIRAVEMDDAAVGYAVQNDYVHWYSVRNASDPVMPDISHDSDAQAAKIYRKYGYWTTVNSAIACWALIAGSEVV
jgi:nucleoside phosphorylase